MSDNKKDDLTNIFNLSDFNHEEDPDADEYFAKKKAQSDLEDKLRDLGDEDEDEDTEDEFEEDEHERTQVNFKPEDLEQDESDEDFESFDDNDDFEEADTQPEHDQWADEEFELSDDLDSFSSDTIDEDFDIAEEETEITSEIEEDEDEEAPVIDEVQIAAALAAISTPQATQAPEPQKSYENLEDIHRFAQNSRYSKLSSKGNPPFSMIISGVKYLEDSQKIFKLLKEYGFINGSNETIIKNSLDRGSAIISRVSEFAVIFLYHKLHAMEVELTVGHSDTIFKSSTESSMQIGEVSSDNLLQNKEDHIKVGRKDAHTVLFTSSDQAPGYMTKEFLGYCSKSVIIQAYPLAGELEQTPLDLEKREQFELARQTLTDELKAIIVAKEGNAGLNFKISTTALFNEKLETFEYEIKAECNAAWIERA